MLRLAVCAALVVAAYALQQYEVEILKGKIVTKSKHTNKEFKLRDGQCEGVLRSPLYNPCTDGLKITSLLVNLQDGTKYPAVVIADDLLKIQLRRQQPCAGLAPVVLIVGCGYVNAPRGDVKSTPQVADTTKHPSWFPESMGDETNTEDSDGDDDGDDYGDDDVNSHERRHHNHRHKRHHHKDHEKDMMTPLLEH